MYATPCSWFSKSVQRQVDASSLFYIVLPSSSQVQDILMEMDWAGASILSC